MGPSLRFLQALSSLQEKAHPLRGVPAPSSPLLLPHFALHAQAWGLWSPKFLLFFFFFFLTCQTLSLRCCLVSAGCSFLQEAFLDPLCTCLFLSISWEPKETLLAGAFSQGAYHFWNDRMGEGISSAAGLDL